MRRRTELKRADHAAETLIHRLALVTGNLERLIHDVRAVIPDCAAGELDAVADNVILIGEDVKRFLIEKRIHSPLRHGERVVAEYDLVRLLIQFKHREVHDPAEFEHIRVNEPEPVSELGPDLPADLKHLRLLIGKEEHYIAGLNRRHFLQPSQFLRFHELDDRALFPFRGPDDVSHAFCTDTLGKRNHIVVELAGLCAADSRNFDRADYAAVLDGRGKCIESAVGKHAGNIHHLKRIAEVGLVGAVFRHRLTIRDTHKRSVPHLFPAELLEDMAEQFFNDGENIVLRHKTHLHVKLIELAGRTVRSCILVAETGCDLEITVESRNHKQLFELLRRLRQSIELAGMDTARNEIVTCAFRRTAGQDRGLIFHESHIAHEPADFGNDLGTQQNVLMQFFAAQIKKTVFQAQCFGCLLIFGYLERNDIRFP